MDPAAHRTMLEGTTEDESRGNNGTKRRESGGTTKAEREQQRDHDDERGNLDRRTDGGKPLGSSRASKVQLRRDLF